MKMQSYENINTHLDHITEEINKVKKVIISHALIERDKEKTQRAWQDLENASKEISNLWKGPTAIDEIKMQREKR
ncbi:MAG: hypothetical protein U9Q22_03325 [Candidatus Altiarchaeota archaeon]|nr:hypothetical protein [Candidatus Altiarchaeota archaeon]